VDISQVFVCFGLKHCVGQHMMGGAAAVHCSAVLHAVGWSAF